MRHASRVLHTFSCQGHGSPTVQAVWLPTRLAPCAIQLLRLLQSGVFVWHLGSTGVVVAVILDIVALLLQLGMAATLTIHRQ